MKLGYRVVYPYKAGAQLHNINCVVSMTNKIINLIDSIELGCNQCVGNPLSSPSSMRRELSSLEYRC